MGVCTSRNRIIISDMMTRSEVTNESRFVAGFTAIRRPEEQEIASQPISEKLVSYKFGKL